MASKRIAYVTLGCKLNFSETSTLAREFASRGYSAVPAGEEADVYVINTCSVTETADKKCRNAIRKFHKLSPEAVIAVTGCYAQLKAEEIAGIEGVSVVAGARDKGRLCDLVEEALANASEKGKGKVYNCSIDEVDNIFPACSHGERTRTFLKVQDGCDYRCSYCTVPLARGHSRNLPIADIVAQARRAASEGMKEIVITGVNTGDFGKTTGESFLDLLKALNSVEGIERYRISSIEPNLLTEDILKWIASGTKFLPHFHIPIQSGCDKTLKAMHRRYTSAMFEKKISLVRDILETPQERFTKVFFGIDVIVGFPGETEEDFQATYDLLARVRPAFLHVFPYSRRAGTEAASLPGQLTAAVKAQRVARLEELSDRLHAEFCAANRGRTAEVLFESREKGGMMSGYTGNYIRVERPYDPALIGRITAVEL
ncbi:MAG: tRNA (N(6)-L-threonylcarbamoyladenosine(37)-C(2))-methylthiotransferase MtaB [Bacteroidales bacterium]|nr:tRNA (N(6)-L-threonylcarbamoyladenosine(37)-C(2))-methylthiotransferase MtaB [Bacteroidales bacterium]